MCMKSYFRLSAVLPFGIELPFPEQGNPAIPSDGVGSALHSIMTREVLSGISIDSLP
jgi:hypothetical protein